MSTSGDPPWLPPVDIGPVIRRYVDAADDEVKDLIENLHGPLPEAFFDIYVDETPIWAKLAELDILPWLATWFVMMDDWRWDPRQSGRLGRRAAGWQLPGWLRFVLRLLVALVRRLLRRPDPEPGPEPDRAVGVAWSFKGQHSRDGTFNGLPPTNRDVVVRGFTIMGIHDHEFRLWRYIDWIDLYTQLGLTINWRVPVGPLPDPDLDDRPPDG